MKTIKSVLSLIFTEKREYVYENAHLRPKLIYFSSFLPGSKKIKSSKGDHLGLLVPGKEMF